MISCWFKEIITIVSTSFVGAYAIIRPFGWIAGHFPNEFTVAKEISYNKLKGMPNEFYLYLALIFIVAGIGMRF